jgi:hypothetical protein
MTKMEDYKASLSSREEEKAGATWKIQWTVFISTGALP